jgi:hypothetical protein
MKPPAIQQRTVSTVSPCATTHIGLAGPQKRPPLLPTTVTSLIHDVHRLDVHPLFSACQRLICKRTPCYYPQAPGTQLQGGLGPDKVDCLSLNPAHAYPIFLPPQWSNRPRHTLGQIMTTIPPPCARARARATGIEG